MAAEARGEPCRLGVSVLRFLDLEAFVGLAGRLAPGQVAAGPAYTIGGRRLRPVARVRSLGSAERGWRLRWVEPLGVAESGEGQRHWHPVGTGALPAAVVIVALVAPVVAYLVTRRLSRD